MTIEQGNNIISSKPRYECLDGLRGVAAIMVLIFHCMETYSWKTGIQIIDHGYLAVDFFFILSGFVVGYAYDDRWKSADNEHGMTFWSFIKRRLIRLHPMVIMGTVIGAFAFLFRDCDMFAVSQADGWTFLAAVLMCLVMIPCTNNMVLKLHGWDEFNPLNGPNWSLTYEYIANLVYALVLRHLPTLAICLLCAISAFFTLDLTLGWDVFEFFPNSPQYTVIGGWNFSATHFYIGFTRLAYPFLCGYLISRLAGNTKSRINTKWLNNNHENGFWWCSIILIIVFSIPRIDFIGQIDQSSMRGVADGLYQALNILLVFPVVILLGAGSQLTGKRGAAICKWLGDISFPLYITHYPLMYCQMAWITSHPNAATWMHAVLNVGVILMSLGIAWSCLKLYDEPVRKWLTTKNSRI